MLAFRLFLAIVATLTPFITWFGYENRDDIFTFFTISERFVQSPQVSSSAILQSSAPSPLEHTSTILTSQRVLETQTMNTIQTAVPTTYSTYEEGDWSFDAPIQSTGIIVGQDVESTAMPTDPTILDDSVSFLTMVTSVASLILCSFTLSTKTILTAILILAFLALALPVTGFLLIWYSKAARTRVLHRMFPSLEDKMIDLLLPQLQSSMNEANLKVLKEGEEKRDTRMEEQVADRLAKITESVSQLKDLPNSMKEVRKHADQSVEQHKGKIAQLDQSVTTLVENMRWAEMNIRTIRDATPSIHGLGQDTVTFDQKIGGLITTSAVLVTKNGVKAVVDHMLGEEIDRRIKARHGAFLDNTARPFMLRKLQALEKEGTAKFGAWEEEWRQTSASTFNTLFAEMRRFRDSQLEALVDESKQLRDSKLDAFVEESKQELSSKVNASISSIEQDAKQAVSSTLSALSSTFKEESKKVLDTQASAMETQTIQAIGTKLDSMLDDRMKQYTEGKLKSFFENKVKRYIEATLNFFSENDMKQAINEVKQTIDENLPTYFKSEMDLSIASKVQASLDTSVRKFMENEQKKLDEFLKSKLKPALQLVFNQYADTKFEKFLNHDVKTAMESRLLTFSQEEIKKALARFRENEVDELLQVNGTAVVDLQDTVKSVEASLNAVTNTVNSLQTTVQQPNDSFKQSLEDLHHKLVNMNMILDNLEGPVQPLLNNLNGRIETLETLVPKDPVEPLLNNLNGRIETLETLDPKTPMEPMLKSLNDRIENLEILVPDSLDERIENLEDGFKVIEALGPAMRQYVEGSPNPKSTQAPPQPTQNQQNVFAKQEPFESVLQQSNAAAISYDKGKNWFPANPENAAPSVIMQLPTQDMSTQETPTQDTLMVETPAQNRSTWDPPTPTLDTNMRRIAVPMRRANRGIQPTAIPPIFPSTPAPSSTTSIFGIQGSMAPARPFGVDLDFGSGQPTPQQPPEPLRKTAEANNGGAGRDDVDPLAQDPNSDVTPSPKYKKEDRKMMRSIIKEIGKYLDENKGIQGKPRREMIPELKRMVLGIEGDKTISLAFTVNGVIKLALSKYILIKSMVRCMQTSRREGRAQAQVTLDLDQLITDEGMAKFEGLYKINDMMDDALAIVQRERSSEAPA